MISAIDTAVVYVATKLTEGDYSVLLWIQDNWRTSGGDIFWNVVTNGVFWVFAFLAVWLILRNRKQGRQVVLYAGTSLVLALAVKSIFVCKFPLGIQNTMLPPYFAAG